MTRQPLRQRVLPIVGLSFSCLMLGIGCTTILPPSVPVAAKLSANSRLPAAQSRLIVLLPGRHSRGSHFEREGIIRELTRLADTDVVAVDLHFGYYRNRTFLERLRNDVILPSRKKGYREIHLMGVSMGGMGALFYASMYPEEVEALALLSPFVGDEEILSEIRTAGGLRNWESGEISKTDYQRRLWAGLRDLLQDGRDGHIVPSTWLACGRSDRLFDSNDFFASQFSLGKPRSFLVTEGDHDWKSWTRMTQAYRELLAQ